ncbi:M56 family metallopeptidase [Ginsengibacter hankyongi]|uniref:M56 family metallopeptidase n=1 Tax=Ginsengibacter hankyongi TaxID=2607284 RepID=A0A5J5IEM3_9BACT|nr:M56 family metallopeptidase [Ginsengibacter hankyongi]KAA9037733.1 M56 family metallopeptidase [Ginsengibacter hankyongi]
MDFAALQHSVFLQALGSAILNSLWQAFILWLLYETISASYKNASAKFKNNLSTVLVFFSFILFLAGFVSKIINHQSALSITYAITNTAKVAAAEHTSAFEKFLLYAGSSLPYLSVAYIFLLFFLMAKLFTAYRYVYKISNRRLINPPAELQAFAQRVAGQMKITRKICVWVSHHIDVPATIGFIKPVILIPFASLNNLSTDQLEAIILHELSHIKRNDYIINIMVSVIETILFFNPFVVLLSKVIKRERENCCDDFVLQYRYDPHSYASALLRLEQSRATNLKLAIGAVSGKKQLLSRIKRITKGQSVSRQFNYGQKLLALLLVTGILCSLAWLSPGEKRQVPVRIIKKDIEVKKILHANDSAKVLVLHNAVKENSPAKTLKHISLTKELKTFDEKDNNGFPVEENNNFTFNTEINGTNGRAPLPMNFNGQQYFFDGSKLKLPQSINIRNLPFQNGDFKIDLSNIDINELNEGLKQAYKEINNINWNEVQNNIRESLSKIKSTDFPGKIETQTFMENAKQELSKLKGDKGKFGKLYLLDNLNKEIRLHDSLSSTIMRMIYSKNERVQREYQRVPDHPKEKALSNPYYKYRINTSPSPEDETETDGNELVSVNASNNSFSTGESKKTKIILKPSEKSNAGVHQRKILQFSFDTNTKKPGHQNVVNVEVTDLP